MQTQSYMDQARQEWNQARRKAFWSQLLANLDEQGSGLLDFNDISHRLNLKTAVYRGVQNIPLDKIVGSVGRYQDFTRAFLPVVEDMSSRWQRVAALYLDPTSGGVPPIEVYKVGDAYFVKDGNHRVSVARQLNMEDIEAYVWEYPQPVAGIAPDTDIDTLLIEAERRDFMEQTHLDDLRPGNGIRLTAPGGYTELLRQIDRYRAALSQIDETTVSYEEAVTAWYDMLYETTVQLIREAGVLDLFPDRTAADFFVCVTRQQRELEERYGRRIKVGEAARDFRKRARARRRGRPWNSVLRWLARRMA